MKRSIEKLLQERILVLDGGMGSLIQQYKLQEKDYRGKRFVNHSKNQKGNNDLLSLTQPSIINKIHCEYLEVGADIIETNTFNSTSLSLDDYGMQELAYEINFCAAQIAKKTAQKYSINNPSKPRFVAGSIGPTNKTTSISPNVNDPAFRAVTFDMMVQAYKEQVKGLVDGGVDLLLIETVFDTLNCKAALFAIDEYFIEIGKRLPVMVSATISDASGRTLTGQTPEAFLYSVSHFPLLSIGFNCALGAKQLLPYLQELSDKTSFYISAHPNAGLPNVFGNYDESPISMATTIKEYLEKKLVNIIGGCCGTTPEHIKEIASLVSSYQPRYKPKKKMISTYSGLEPLCLYHGCNFINVGERTNVAGSKIFAQLIKEKKYEEALNIARKQTKNGAQIIDVSMDEAMLDSEKEMTYFLNLLASEPDVAKLPVMIDSSKWTVIEAGLKCLQGKSIVNSISLKEGEKIFKERAIKIKKYGAAVVVMAFDEKGQADTYKKKIEVCQRAYNILVNDVGFPPEDIIFDPNILTIGTGMEEHNEYAVNYINAIKWIKQNLLYTKVSGGVSNLSFSFRGNNYVREAMHSAFLHHAIKAGMDMGIVNVNTIELYENIPAELLEHVEDVVLNRRADATERLINLAEKYKYQQKEKNNDDNWRNESIEKKLQYALVHGITEFIDEDIEDASKQFDCTSIIEIFLMNGMKTVGNMFGDGKMFLPQVIKSARVMKKAVVQLSPYLEKENLEKKKTRNYTKKNFACHSERRCS
ncbi:MAG: methionine synthase [Bacteroidota bacterium]